ncbi:hypothetical protein [Parvularcula maris]|uniref:Yip1 domain-containing protein n=1 Tax=Parvularcula maris TaxID=2965077 RepID=A0A9X2LBD9_9PROT|nr:hypothetical protein [Parvularcula maris]MCQ8186373.1 hypothetical protein [Parvularcula maris]
MARNLDIGLGALTEDLFGLNIRGVRTVAATFIQPREVFDAARHPTWLDRYTPTIRLAFFMLSLTAVFRFLWASEEGAFAAAITEQFVDLADDLGDDFDPAAAMERYFGVYAAMIPFAWLATQSLLSLVLRVWGKGTGAVLRLRLHMTALIPSTLFGLLFLLTMPVLFKDVAALLSAWTFASSGLMVALDVTTSFRGGVGGETRTGRIVRASTFGLFVFLANVVVSVVASAVAYAAVILGSGHRNFV